jgi:hypothetical protein
MSFVVGLRFRLRPATMVQQEFFNGIGREQALDFKESWREMSA